MEDSKINSKHFLFLILIFSTYIVQYTFAHRNGAPLTNEVCDSMRPSPTGHFAEPQTSLIQYSIKLQKTRVLPGEVIKVTLQSNSNSQAFKGFLAIARSSKFLREKEPKGKFLRGAQNNLVQVGNCFGIPSSAVTHSSNVDKRMVDFEWEAPQEKGEYVIVVTFVKNQSTYWVAAPSEVITVIDTSETTQENRPTSANPVTTVATESPLPVIGDVEGFYEGCGDSDFSTPKGCFGIPSGCIESRNCELFVTYRASGEQFIFELAGRVTGGDSSKAYVAVGLSRDNAMSDDSVMGCRLDGNSVAINEYYNVADRGGNDGITRLQSHFENPAGSYVDGHIACTFAVKAQYSVESHQQNYDLTSDEYFLLLSRGTDSSKEYLGKHPEVSDRDVTASSLMLTSATVVGGKSMILIQVHGALMIMAWLFFAPSGMFTARFFKQTHTGKKPLGMALWFLIHRSCMSLTLVLTCISFIIIFVETKEFIPASRDAPAEIAHAILGIILTTFALAQVGIALFRPHPGDKNRPTFNWVHFIIGNTSHVIGLATIALANDMGKTNLQRGSRFYIVLFTFVGLHVILHVIMTILNFTSAKKLGVKYPKKVLSYGPLKPFKDADGDAPGTNLRTIVLMVYMIVAAAAAATMTYFVVDALK